MINSETTAVITPSVRRLIERAWVLLATAIVLLALTIAASGTLAAQDNSACFDCHDDDELTGKKRGRTVSVFVNEAALAKTIHGDLQCTSCHIDVDEDDLPHDDDLSAVKCGICHSDIEDQHAESLHGKAITRGDRLAPRCTTCHGSHTIVAASDPSSPVRAANIPFLCGSCHQEGAPVQKSRKIHQDHILENYSESIHGEGLLKKGLIVTATCISCHTPHFILPHTDSRSSIAKKNIASTCAQCHTQIESVHRKVIKGELWEKQAHTLPACVDCHPPHQIRNVFYDKGMADRDCLRCHEDRGLNASDGRSMFVDASEINHSRHVSVSCSQCHSGVNVSHKRPCDNLTEKVSCAGCHAEMVDQYEHSIHGMLHAKNDPNAPTCLECHGKHDILGKNTSKSRTFPTNVPRLCATCHREGEQAAIRKHSSERTIVNNYNESIHGKGLLQSGLVVTAMCTDCHSAHSALPASDPLSTVHKKNIGSTCGTCHFGIEEQFEQSTHSSLVNDTDKPLPVCSDCHSAHTIRRADTKGFKLEIMGQCGRCHEEISKSYFDTYHGKVSQLGYTKTAKCYDCHGAHDILPISNPQSHLHRDNVVETCQKCHPGANRRFAGYLTHATHHDPDKYPFLFWTFWGMTGLLVFTFFISGLHTLLWLPRSLKLRKAMKAEEHEEEQAAAAAIKQITDAADPEQSNKQKSG